MTLSPDQLRIDAAARNGDHRRLVVAVLMDGGEHRDTIDENSEHARRRFKKAIAEKSGCEVGELSWIDDALYTAAAEADRRAEEQQATKQDDTPPDITSLPEIDASKIVRPERFITLEVSGLAVPTTVDIEGRPVGRWLLHLLWADGRRECGVLPNNLSVGEGRKLWIHPNPSQPNPTMTSGWSSESRRQWIKGSSLPDPVDLFAKICRRIAEFIDLPLQHAPGITATLATWIILTYSYSAWSATPYLFLGGPLGSGKTRVFEILFRLVFRPLMSSNLTAAALFRTLHAQGGVLLYDEAEQLKRTNDPAVNEVRSMLLAGYKRGGQATRLEPVGDTFKTVSFDVYCPKAIACVSGLPPALLSRCIPITMFRAGPGSEKPRRRIDAVPQIWQELRDDLHVMALQNGSTWLELANRTDVCPRMDGRSFELWQPLLAIAAWLQDQGCDGLLELMQKHALATIDSGKSEQTSDADETLLRILARAVRLGQRMTPSEILAEAQESEPAVFKGWWPRSVTARLKSYGIPTPRKSGSRREFRDVRPEVLLQIQSSYGIDLDFLPPDMPWGTYPQEPSQSSQPSESAEKPGNSRDGRDAKDGRDGLTGGGI